MLLRFAISGKITEKAAANCKKFFGNDVKQFKYSEDFLAMPELDAVMIATGDFQHAKLLAEVVRAGKDCYCEKPLSTDVEDAKLAREAVLSSKQVAQMGSQWLSDPMQIKVREIIRSGKLGQITKIEQVWNDNNHRWHDPDDPDVKAIREKKILTGNDGCWVNLSSRLILGNTLNSGYSVITRRYNITMDEPCKRTGEFLY